MLTNHETEPQLTYHFWRLTLQVDLHQGWFLSAQAFFRPEHEHILLSDKHKPGQYPKIRRDHRNESNSRRRSTLSLLLIHCKTNREEEGRTHHSLFPEVNADCGDELGVELVVCISVQEGGLPHAGVPQGKELYKVVIIPISHSDGHEEHLQEDREKHAE